MDWREGILVGGAAGEGVWKLDAAGAGPSSLMGWLGPTPG